MAEVFRQKTMQLAAALEHENEEEREAARQALRGFIDRIVIPPGNALLQVVGNFGEMLTAANGRAEPAIVAYDGCGGPQPAEFGVLVGRSVGFLPRTSSTRSCRSAYRGRVLSSIRSNDPNRQRLLLARRCART